MIGVAGQSKPRLLSRSSRPHEKIQAEKLALENHLKVIESPGVSATTLSAGLALSVYRSNVNRDCRETLHSWTGRYDYFDWRAIDA